MKVYCLIADLIFRSKVDATARALGLPLTYLSMASDPQGVCQPGSLLLVDLNFSSEVIAFIQRLKQAKTPPRIVGYLSHVQTDLAKVARQAGVDEVLPQSIFSKRLPDLLTAQA